MKKNRHLIREQIEKQLGKTQCLINIQVPHKGWIRSIKEALGMNGRQLAERMGVTKQWVSVLDKQELDGSITINTMKKSAEALNCAFVYCLVPQADLEDIVRDQAKKIALNRLQRASHTMSLEDQELDRKENNAIMNNMVERIMNEQPADLWDYHD
ncbi:MAG: mobile mystery protein A [Candidatus Tenebribacter davisii]|nr:mobile mystery protein A [Candidatus Tenebribacter davisii]